MTEPATRPADSIWRPYPGPAGQDIDLRIRRVMSPQLGNFRDVVVALPPSYRDGLARFPVLYMQDGQNLFDPATSFAGDWRLSVTLADLGRRGVEAIVVGIANAGKRRIYEYTPFRDLVRGGGGGDRYLSFVVDTVKPMIDRDLRTRPGRDDTIIAGSSLGGLISLYALWRHPEVFGAAGALSPSIWFARRAILGYLEGIDRPVGRVYLDIGLEEPTGAIADVRALREILLAKGLRPGIELDYLEEEGGLHNEETWGRRVSRALPFLIGLAEDRRAA